MSETVGAGVPGAPPEVSDQFNGSFQSLLKLPTQYLLTEKRKLENKIKHKVIINLIT